jgi:hypothetical protein
MKGRAAGHGDFAASMVLIFPLYLAYAVGVLFTDHVNGVDFVSTTVWWACGGDRTRYLAMHGVLAAAYVVWLRRSGRTGTLTLGIVAPLVLEAAIYALTMATLIQLVMLHVLGPLGVLSIGGAGDRAIASIGAGVHEELVFRLGLCGGGAWLLLRLGLARRVAIPIAVIASSLLFAAAHHLGPSGEPWQRSVFAYRALAGVIFALIFRHRSLAHAVYAHALYDLWILVVLA